MMILKNGSRPLMWSQGLGGGSNRNYIGTVLAEWDKYHPFVVWRMASDDGDKWDTYEGTYCETLEEATEVFPKENWNRLPKTIRSVSDTNENRKEFECLKD